jgi:hypothetical protein
MYHAQHCLVNILAGTMAARRVAAMHPEIKFFLLISALKSKLFPAEDRPPKTWFSVDSRRFAAASA